MPLRRATAADRDWLLALLRDERVAASLSTAAEAGLVDALQDPEDEVLIVADDRGQRVGVACWRTCNRRSRIAGVHTVAIHPDAQGRGHAAAALRELVRLLVDEHGFHRVEAETYGFNTAARRAFTAAGFVEEGVRRAAYDRHGAWQDGVHLGLLADERDQRPSE